MKNKCIFIILIFAVTLLTACGGLKTEQKAQWQEAISQIELLKNTLTENVAESKAYYDSINDEVKERMNKIDFSSFVIDEDWNDISMPEQEKEFSASYDILQQRILKLNNVIGSVPTIELIREQQDEVVKQIEDEKLKAEEEKKRLEEINKTIAKEQRSTTYDSIENDQESTAVSTTRKEYTHSALEGCVIVESDRTTGHYAYQTKCPTCGKVNNSVIRIYNSAGSGRNSSDVCRNSKCSQFGKSFTVKIKITSKTFWE